MIKEPPWLCDNIPQCDAMSPSLCTFAMLPSIAQGGRRSAFVTQTRPSLILKEEMDGPATIGRLFIQDSLCGSSVFVDIILSNTTHAPQ